MGALKFAASASTALALCVPMAANAQSCREEVQAFIETLRDDASFEQIEERFGRIERDLIDAVGETPGECFASLEAAQTRIADAGFIVPGATDSTSIERTAQLVALVDADTQSGPAMEADVEVTPPAAEVELQTSPVDVTVTTPEPEVTVERAEPEVTVETAEPDVTVTQAEPQTDVRSAPREGDDAGSDLDVVPTRPAAAVTQDDEAPEISLTEQQGEVTGPQPKPDVEQAEAEVDLIEGTAQVEVTRSDREVDTDRAESATMAAGQNDRDQDGAAAADARPAIVIADMDTADIAEQPAVAVLEVEFGFDSARVPDAEMERVLSDVVSLVNEHQNPAVLLTGYASPIGNFEYNLELSERRVSAVADALMDMGVPDDIIRTRSLGERNPEVTAAEDERSPDNRRVEIRVLTPGPARS